MSGSKTDQDESPLEDVHEEEKDDDMEKEPSEYEESETEH